MSDFERYAVRRLLGQARAAGVEVPRALARVCGNAASHGAVLYARLVDEESMPPEASGCCWGAAARGPADCTCWEPVYDVGQAPPRPPQSPDDLEARQGLCGDCAFRKGSPERATQWEEEALFDLAAQGDPFWCHDGMRRPVAWCHPQLGEIVGDPDNWTPPQVAGIPYRADGRPGLLCAGWVARRSSTLAKLDASTGGHTSCTPPENTPYRA